MKGAPSRAIGLVLCVGTLVAATPAPAACREPVRSMACCCDPPDDAAAPAAAARATFAHHLPPPAHRPRPGPGPSPVALLDLRTAFRC
jgi:hypothetical protein